MVFCLRRVDLSEGGGAGGFVRGAGGLVLWFGVGGCVGDGGGAGGGVIAVGEWRGSGRGWGRVGLSRRR